MHTNMNTNARIHRNTHPRTDLDDVLIHSMVNYPNYINYPELTVPLPGLIDDWCLRVHLCVYRHMYIYIDIPVCVCISPH